MTRLVRRSRIRELLAAASLAGVFAACAPAVSSTAGGGRAEEQVATRRDPPSRADSAAAPVTGGSDTPLPLRDARAVHGTIDPATGRRTAEPAVGARLREPKRVEIQTGRLRQASEEYEPGSGQLPYGYRIQVTAKADFAAAGREATRIKELLGGRYPVYLEFIDPWYKVRVGDFSTVEAAQPALGDIRRLGYPDAWPVRTTIKAAQP